MMVSTSNSIVTCGLWLLCLFLMDGGNSHVDAASKSETAHIQHLMSTMTLYDKIGQMAQVDINDLCEDDPTEEGKKRLAEDKVKTVIGEHGVGSVLNYIQGRPFTPKEFRQAVMYIQAVAKNYSRPPVIWGLDSVHGANYVHGAVLSPQPINLAATFNTSVAYRAGRLSSRDTRAVGINWLFAPLMGIAIEPKWSRVYETFGEDPVVVQQMGSNFIAGIQEDANDGGIPSKAAACAKHFIGYSAPHNGHDRSPSWIPTRHLYQYFLPPWKAAVQDQKVLTVMESYSEVDGVPSVGNPTLLRYLLRQRLGFQGVLVTDYEEILNLKNWHHISSSERDAVVHSLREGSVDMSMIPHNDLGFRDSVSEGVSNGTLVEERINLSVERVLRLKSALNMFNEEIVMDDSNLAKIGQDEEEALDMATQSMVLVKNEQNILPLDPGKGGRVLVTGPTARSLQSQSGGWTGEWQGVPEGEENKYFTYGTNVLDAMHLTFTGWTVKYACGVDILGHECTDPLDDKVDKGGSGGSVLDQFKNWAGLGPSGPSNSMERAAGLASSSDVVVVCIGEEPYTEKPGDIRSMDLPIGQYELVSFIKSNTNAKVVVVYFGGRTRLLRQIFDYADAILLGFLPGPSGGLAVANLLSGLANPSGKLPITYPMYEDGGGSPYFHTISDQCTRQNDNTPLPHWEYLQCPVQWPFGFGLTFTRFEYSQLSLSSKKIQYTTGGKKLRNEPLTLSVSVKNKGTMAGYETVFFFTFDESRSTTPEYKRLRAFQKIFLEVGEEKTVSATIPIDDLKFIGPHDDTHLIVEHGLQFRVGVGAKTDCRGGGQDSALCSDVLSIDAGDNYIAACDTACELWANSGCAEELQLSSKKCWTLCTSVSNNPDVAKHLGEGEDGWGWNYVQCLESVIWGFQQQQVFDKDQCSKMTSLCRDIFRTDGIDSFGHGPDVQFAGRNTAQPTSVIVALCAGLIASVLVFFTLRGGFANGGRGDIEFSRVSNEESLTI